MLVKEREEQVDACRRFLIVHTNRHVCTSTVGRQMTTTTDTRQSNNHDHNRKINNDNDNHNDDDHLDALHGHEYYHLQVVGENHLDLTSTGSTRTASTTNARIYYLEGTNSCPITTTTTSSSRSSNSRQPPYRRHLTSSSTTRTTRSTKRRARKASSSSSNKLLLFCSRRNQLAIMTRLLLFVTCLFVVQAKPKRKKCFSSSSGGGSSNAFAEAKTTQECEDEYESGYPKTLNQEEFELWQIQCRHAIQYIGYSVESTPSSPTLFVSPIAEETKSPTESPIKSPTESPVESPTSTPTSTPTVTPTSTPTKTPVKAPVIANVPTPTKGPTSQPVVAPVDECPEEPDDNDPVDDGSDGDDGPDEYGNKDNTVSSLVGYKYSITFSETLSEDEYNAIVALLDEEMTKQLAADKGFDPMDDGGDDSGDSGSNPDESICERRRRLRLLKEQRRERQLQWIKHMSNLSSSTTTTAALTVSTAPDHNHHRRLQESTEVLKGASSDPADQLTEDACEGGESDCVIVNGGMDLYLDDSVSASDQQEARKEFVEYLSEKMANGDFNGVSDKIVSIELIESDVNKSNPIDDSDITGLNTGVPVASNNTWVIVVGSIGGFLLGAVALLVVKRRQNDDDDDDDFDAGAETMQGGDLEKNHIDQRAISGQSKRNIQNIDTSLHANDSMADLTMASTFMSSDRENSPSNSISTFGTMTPATNAGAAGNGKPNSNDVTPNNLYSSPDNEIKDRPSMLGRYDYDDEDDGLHDDDALLFTNSTVSDLQMTDDEGGFEVGVVGGRHSQSHEADDEEDDSDEETTESSFQDKRQRRGSRGGILSDTSSINENVEFLSADVASSSGGSTIGSGRKEV